MMMKKYMFIANRNLLNVIKSIKPMNLSLILISQYLFAASYQNIIGVYAKILYVSTYVNNYLNDSYHCGTSCSDVRLYQR